MNRRRMKPSREVIVDTRIRCSRILRAPVRRPDAGCVCASGSNSCSCRSHCHSSSLGSLGSATIKLCGRSPVGISVLDSQPGFSLSGWPAGRLSHREHWHARHEIR